MCKTCRRITASWFTVDGECWFCIARKHDMKLVIRHQDGTCECRRMEKGQCSHKVVCPNEV